MASTINFYFLTLKQLLGRSLCTFIRYASCIAIIASIIFPSITSKDISLQFLGRVQLSLFPFLSRIIFATFYYNGSLPYLSEVKKSVQICYCKTSQTSLYTLIVKPLLPTTLSRLIENSTFLILSIINALLKSQSLKVSPMYLGLQGIGSSRKKLCSSSFTILALS